MFWKPWHKITEYEQQGIDAVQDFVKKIVEKHGKIINLFHPK